MVVRLNPIIYDPNLDLVHYTDYPYDLFLFNGEFTNKRRANVWSYVAGIAKNQMPLILDFHKTTGLDTTGVASIIKILNLRRISTEIAHARTYLSNLNEGFQHIFNVSVPSGLWQNLNATFELPEGVNLDSLALNS